MKIVVDSKIVYFLESFSAKMPLYSAPTQAPNSRMAVNQPFRSGFVTASPIY